MLNGKIKVNGNETEFKLTTHVALKWKRQLEISLVIDKRTTICEVYKNTNQCVVFLNGEHVIINEEYQKIKELQNQLKWN